MTKSRYFKGPSTLSLGIPWYFPSLGFSGRFSLFIMETQVFRWEVDQPYVTYPLIQADVPVNFKWQAACDLYNARKPAGADPMAPLNRSEGGFYLAPAGAEDCNETIRQLRKVKNVFTPLLYQGLYREEYTLLCQVLNDLTGLPAFRVVAE